MFKTVIPASVVRMSLGLVLCGATFAAAEVVLVEPINGRIDDIPLVATSTKVAKAECGGRTIDPDPMDCYEFAFVYVTYDSSGTRVIHIPHPKAGDPSQAPIPATDNLEVQVIPVGSDPLDFGFSWTRWDHRRVFLHQYLPSPSGSGVQYTVAKVRFPAYKIPFTGSGQLALVRGVHWFRTPDAFGGGDGHPGWFNPLTREFLNTQMLAESFEDDPVPVYFVAP